MLFFLDNLEIHKESYNISRRNYMIEIVENVIEKELYYKNTVVLKYTIKYPSITWARNRFVQRKFNSYNYERAMELAQYAEMDLFKEAKELFDYNSSKGYPVMVFEVYYTYEVTYQNNSVVSLYTDEYMFLGGAHGNTKRESQNWNMQNGRFIELKDLYPNDSYYIINILKNINSQIAKQISSGQNQYFDNYCQLVLENFNLDSFYITKEGVVIFFNQYEIAPYSSGIPTFLI